MKKLYNFICLIILFSCNKSAGDTANVASPVATGQGGSLARFTIVGNYLYTVNKQNLQVFNLEMPTTPSLIRTIPIGFEIETIYPFRDKLFIGSSSMVYIFSISDPANPEKLGVAISPDVLRRCDPVVAMDSVAYATLRTNGPCGGTRSILAVYDIRNISNPVQKNAMNISEPYGLGYSGNALYVCDKIQGLVVYNISQPYTPVFVRQVGLSTASFIDVIPFNNILICWTTTGMVLYDISNKFNPAFITQIN